MRCGALSSRLWADHLSAHVDDSVKERTHGVAMSVRASEASAREDRRSARIFFDECEHLSTMLADVGEVHVEQLAEGLPRMRMVGRAASSELLVWD